MQDSYRYLKGELPGDPYTLWFQVMAFTDIHLILGPDEEPTPRDSDPAYRIDLGKVVSLAVLFCLCVCIDFCLFPDI